MRALLSHDDRPLRALGEFRGASIWQQLAAAQPLQGPPPGTWLPAYPLRSEAQLPEGHSCR